MEKVYYVLVTFILLQLSVYAQPDTSAYFQEGILFVEGADSSMDIIFTLEAQGTVWANSSITQLYRVARDTTHGEVLTGSDYGWRIFWQNEDGENIHEPFAHGIYKLSSNHSESYVFIDFRDCQFANEDFNPNDWYNPTDFYIKYKVADSTFHYGNSPLSFTYIPRWMTIGIWDIKNGNPISSCFDSFWQYCLNGGELIEWPLLTWGSHPSFSADGYIIYRTTSCGPLSDVEAYAEPIDTVGATVFTFTDEEFNFYIDCDYVYYFVKAYNSSGTSSRTNIVSMKGGIGGIV